MVLQIGDLKLAQLTWYQFERYPVFLLNFAEFLVINFDYMFWNALCFKTVGILA